MTEPSQQVPGYIPSMRTRFSIPVWTIALCLGLASVVGWATQPATVASMATFNIENFPRDTRQPKAAAAVIAKLDVPVVAVQEIRAGGRLLAAVREALGPSWVFLTHTGAVHRVGILVDTREYVIVDVKVHDEVRVIRGGRPALEVRLRHRWGFATQSVVVVHLKSGPGAEAIRRAQLQALAKQLAGHRGPLTVLGDFNPVSAIDRRDLERFAHTTGLSWITRNLGCTAYFPDGERCRGVALDHVMSAAPGRAKALGACATVGCEPGDRCPRWVGEVSDHCPVVFSPDRRLRLPKGE
ncbi:MAG: endonuclease/exonuclease/phosphatase family protein [Myxococcota bacterium]